MKRIVFATLAFLAALNLSAEADPGVKVSIDGIRHDWYVVPTGVDLGFTWGSWKLAAGIGYEHFDLGRDTATGDPLASDTNPYSKQPFANETVSLRHTWVLDEVDLWVGAGETGYGDLGSGAASGVISDLGGNWFGFVEAGATRDRRLFNAHGLESGTFAEASAQWSPPALAARGTDYERFRIVSSAFFPLWDLDGPVQTFSGLVALRANARWTDGKRVPFPLLMATEVRGYNQLYQSRLLSVLTAELRMRLPSWYGVHSLVPVGFGFVDAGQYLGYADSTSANDKSGFLMGIGIGGGLEFFGVATPTLTLGLPLAGTGGTFWWALDFNLKF